MGTDAESTKQGKLLKIKGDAWYAQTIDIGTFLGACWSKARLNQLKIILDGVST